MANHLVVTKLNAYAAAARSAADLTVGKLGAYGAQADSGTDLTALKLGAYGAGGNVDRLTVQKIVAYAAISSEGVGTIDGQATLAGVSAIQAMAAGDVVGQATLAGTGASESAAHGTISGATTLTGESVTLAKGVGAVMGRAQLVGGVTTTPLVVTKLNAYASEGSTGKLQVSKLAAYAPGGSDDQLQVSKLAGYGPGGSTARLTVSKLVAYAALSPVMSSTGTITGAATLLGISPGPPFNPSVCQAPPLQIEPSSLAAILASYLYQQYTDDDDLQGFVVAYNSMAQVYQDWFNATPLGVYTSPGISGSLLDWIGQGVYGIRRPVVGTLGSFTKGALATLFFGQIAMAAEKTTQTGSASPVNDDIYKRVLTWWLYRGDGKQMSIDWIKRRISRFMYGVNGTDFPYPPCSPNPLFSVEYGVAEGFIGAIGTFPMASLAMGASKPLRGGLSTFTITVPASPAGLALQLLVSGGFLALPFENNFIVELS